MKRTGGFTLIEVLMAVAVIAIALGAFIGVAGEYADHARYLHDKTLALWVARNQMVAFQLDKTWPDTGKSDGRAAMGDRKWQWQATIKATSDPQVRRIDIAVHRIDVESHQPADGALVTLSGFITATASAGAAPSSEPRSQQPQP